MIDCKNQKDIGHFWNKLSKGGKEIQCLGAKIMSEESTRHRLWEARRIVLRFPEGFQDPLVS